MKAMDFDIDVESDSESYSSSDEEQQDKYATKFEILSKKCGLYQKENHMLVLRLLKVKKRVNRLRKEKRFLMKILDKYEDKYRAVPLTIAVEDDKIDL